MSKLHQQQARQRDALRKASRAKHGGISQARRALERTTLALLREEANRARIAPAHAANAARREAGQASLFEGV